MRKRFPAMMLFFLATAMGELLSGSSPPLQFFNPLAFMFMGLLYGGGAILIRELALRWKKGWPSIVVLAVAYGIIEEGLCCKSFFAPNWMDLGAMQYYGRWFDVNWPWSVNLTIFHTFVSISIPILLTELIFPDRKGEPIVSQKGFNTLAVLFAAVVVLGFAFMKPSTSQASYYPSPVHVVLTLVVITALVQLARRLPESLSHSIGKTSAPHPLWLLPTGFLFGVGFFITLFALPSLEVHPMTDMMAAVLLVAVGARLFYGWSNTDTAWADFPRIVLMVVTYLLLVMVTFFMVAVSLDRLKMAGLPIAVLLILSAVWIGRRIPRWSSVSTRWSALHTLAGAIGGLMPFILTSFILPFRNAQQPDDTTGMSLVGMAAIAFLAWLWREVSARESKSVGGMKCNPITP